MRWVKLVIIIVILCGCAGKVLAGGEVSSSGSFTILPQSEFFSYRVLQTVASDGEYTVWFPIVIKHLFHSGIEGVNPLLFYDVVGVGVSHESVIVSPVSGAFCGSYNMGLNPGVDLGGQQNLPELVLDLVGESQTCRELIDSEGWVIFWEYDPYSDVTVLAPVTRTDSNIQVLVKFDVLRDLNRVVTVEKFISFSGEARDIALNVRGIGWVKLTLLRDGGVAWGSITGVMLNDTLLRPDSNGWYTLYVTPSGFYSSVSNYQLVGEWLVGVLKFKPNVYGVTVKFVTRKAFVSLTGSTSAPVVDGVELEHYPVIKRPNNHLVIIRVRMV